MNVTRINCFHDNERVWEGINKNIIKTTEKSLLSFKIYMDLTYPKFRTTLPGKKQETQNRDGT